MYKKLPWQARVLTFEELYKKVKNETGEVLDGKIKLLADELIKTGADDREFSLRIVQEVHKLHSDNNPVIIIYFAPPFYPHIFVEGADKREANLLNAVEQAVKEARQKCKYNIVVKKFYPYISDLSYCSISKNESSISKLVNNMPAWPGKYSLPVEAIQQISMPVVNIGPYGKDAHKLTERLSQSYSFDTMPMILEKTIASLLNERT